MCRGWNGNGQIGPRCASSEECDWTTIDVGPGIALLASTDAGSCVVGTGRTSWVCWGGIPNSAGGRRRPSPGVRPRPSEVMQLDAPVTALRSGDAVTCAVLEDGTAWCLDDGPQPPLVPGLRREPTLVARDVRDIAVTDGAVCTLSSTGEIACWGPGSIHDHPIPLAPSPPGRVLAEGVLGP